MIKKFIEKLTENFSKRLERKTNWGRNELMVEFTNAINETLMDLID